jgi:glucose-1-phosphate cytidylyltransferase
MKAVILAGGLGTRLSEETAVKPKPMVEIGGRPILWHIMKNLSAFGITDFIIATGYKSDMIKEYFLNYEARNNDFTIELGRRDSLTFHDAHDEAHWNVTVAYTGEATLTGGRVFRSAKYLDDQPFLVTYGDGLANVDISALQGFHAESGKLATVTTVQPTSRFGVMDIDSDGSVQKFREKPTLDEWVNIGFFVMQPEVISYLDPDCTLEDEPLTRLASARQLSAFKHEGFWQPMDTYRESKILNELWDSGNAPWKVWE